MGGPGYDCGGRGMGFGPGYGRNQRDSDWKGLSKEDAAALEAARERFRSETRELRDAIEQKQLDLRKEMVNDTIDTAKATSIQKELSQLKSELEQKAFAHRLEVRQLLPQDVDGREYGRGGFGRGYGRRCQ
jgi:Spy/CpxP family protein refolding chaperone